MVYGMYMAKLIVLLEKVGMMKKTMKMMIMMSMTMMKMMEVMEMKKTAPASMRWVRSSRPA